jgi:hypothetical protein
MGSCTDLLGLAASDSAALTVGRLKAAPTYTHTWYVALATWHLHLNL